MRQLLAAITLLAGLAGLTAATPALAAGKASMTHIVMQVSDNDPAKWQLALNNAENVRQALGKKVSIEIVAYGPGLNMLKADSKVAAGLNGALDNNVELAACGTTMKKMKLTKADLIGGAKVVPGGVIEIMKRQSEGWSYVRP
ncbi:MAG: DsrE family protein [Acidobacteriota bacterium]|nr:DsrE family protein [Acidobacteriota bacterium]